MKWLAAAVPVVLLLGAAGGWQAGWFGQRPDASPATPRVATAPAATGTHLPGPPLGKDRVAAALDADPSAPVPVRTALNIETPLHYGEFVWNDKGVPTGARWIRIDLKHQILSIFRGGHEIGTSVILYGADAKPTPVGDFPILAMMKDHRSNLYDAPMPYTMRLTPDGVAIHGSNVRWGAATHGCIGVPKDFAAKLFEVAQPGDRVTIVPADNRVVASSNG